MFREQGCTSTLFICFLWTVALIPVWPTRQRFLFYVAVRGTLMSWRRLVLSLVWSEKLGKFLLALTSKNTAESRKHEMNARRSSAYYTLPMQRTSWSFLTSCCKINTHMYISKAKKRLVSKSSHFHPTIRHDKTCNINLYYTYKCIAVIKKELIMLCICNQSQTKTFTYNT